MQVRLSAVKSLSQSAKRSIIRFLVYFGLSMLISRVRLSGDMMPFGAAFCAAAFCARKHVNLGAVFMGAIAGNFVIWQDGSLEHLVLLSVLCAAFCGLSVVKLKKEKIAVMAAALCVYAFCVAVFPKGDILKTVMWLFEAAISVVMIFVFGAAFRLKNGGKLRSVLLDEEIISVCFVCLVVVLGMSDIAVLGVYVRNIAAVVLSLIAAYTGGCAVGAAVGLILGFGVLLCGGDPFFMGNIAMGAFIAGLLNKTNRLFCGLGLVLINVIMTFYVSDTQTVILPLLDSAIGIAVFCLLPIKFLDYVSSFIDANVSRMRTQKMNIKRFRELTVGRLNEISELFSKASQIFMKETDKKGDFGYVLRTVREKACENCEKYFCCWGDGKIAEKEFKKAYIEYKIGGIGRLSREFALSCINRKTLEDGLRDSFYVFETTEKVLGRMSASKRIVGEQLVGVSKVITGLGREFDAQINFSDELERMIRYRLELSGVKPYEISVENSSGEYAVYVKVRSCGGRRICDTTMSKVISEVIGVSMEPEKELCQMTENYCSLSFVRKKKIAVNAYAFSIPKSGNEVCGDTHIINSYKDGKFMLLLCDGMGNGIKARNQSEAAAELMSTFYKAGFDDTTIIDSINKLLLLSSPDDTYSTMDLCMIDKNSGIATFTKTGSPPAFIFRKGGVIRVEGEALPVGIVDEIKPSRRTVSLQEGDVIIMLSDGISDLAVDTGKFIKNCIDDENISKIPGEVISSALQLCGGRAGDDMTVIAAKIKSA